MTRIMNKTTLVFVAVLAASTLIIGTMGTLQPAAGVPPQESSKTVE